MIKAECHSDDRAVEVSFDATPWFEQASQEDIESLKECGWGGDYPADDVAIFMAEHNGEIQDMFKYIEFRHKIEHIGFECHVDSEDAEKWIKSS
jgi:hypothetical protein